MTLEENAQREVEDPLGDLWRYCPTGHMHIVGECRKAGAEALRTTDHVEGLVTCPPCTKERRLEHMHPQDKFRYIWRPLGIYSLDKRFQQYTPAEGDGEKGQLWRTCPNGHTCPSPRDYCPTRFAGRYLALRRREGHSITCEACMKDERLPKSSPCRFSPTDFAWEWRPLETT